MVPQRLDAHRVRNRLKNSPELMNSGYRAPDSGGGWSRRASPAAASAPP